MWVIVGIGAVILVVAVLVFYSCCVVSGQCSREDELRDNKRAMKYRKNLEKDRTNR